MTTIIIAIFICLFVVGETGSIYCKVRASEVGIEVHDQDAWELWAKRWLWLLLVSISIVIALGTLQKMEILK